MVRKITKSKLVEMYLNDYSKRYYLRELASLLEKPHQTIKPHIEALVKEGVIIKIKRKNIVEYSLNFKDKKVHDYLIIAEKERLMERLKEDIIMASLFEKLSSFFKNSTFIVFGSASDKIQKGSDIDLLVIGKQNISKVIGDFEEVYNRKIHKVQIADIEKLTLTLAKEIYKKHLILNNTEHVIMFFGGLYEENRLV